MSENKTIRVYIKPKDGEAKYVSAELLANYLHSMQSMLYHIADEIEGNKSRKGGDFPGKFKQEYQLVIKDMKMGSADVQLAIFDGQTILEGTEHTIGTQAIGKINEIIDKIPQDHDIDELLEPIVSDDLRRERVIEILDNIWPGPDDNYTVEIDIGKSKNKPLNPKYKKYIVKEMEKPEESCEKTYVGRLTRLSVDKNRDLQINSTEGIIKCTYDNLDRFLSENNIIGTLIKVRGTLTIDKKGSKLFTIHNEKDIQIMEGIPLQLAKIGEDYKMFKKPLIISQDYENDEYILYNDQLSIHAISDNLKDAIDDILKSIEVLWYEYVDADPETLTEDAIEFRNMFKGLFKE